MTDHTNPTNIGTLAFENQSIQLYDDGEFVCVTDGAVDCSEHGNIAYDDIAQVQCNHMPSGKDPDPDPVFDVGAFLGEAAQDKRIQNAVLERISVSDPEKLADAAAPLFEGERS